MPCFHTWKLRKRFNLVPIQSYRNPLRKGKGKPWSLHDKSARIGKRFAILWLESTCTRNQFWEAQTSFSIAIEMINFPSLLIFFDGFYTDEIFEICSPSLQNRNNNNSSTTQLWHGVFLSHGSVVYQGPLRIVLNILKGIGIKLDKNENPCWLCIWFNYINPGGSKSESRVEHSNHQLNHTRITISMTIWTFSSDTVFERPNSIFQVICHFMEKVFVWGTYTIAANIAQSRLPFPLLSFVYFQVGDFNGCSWSARLALFHLRESCGYNWYASVVGFASIGMFTCGSGLQDRIGYSQVITGKVLCLLPFPCFFCLFLWFRFTLLRDLRCFPLTCFLAFMAQVIAFVLLPSLLGWWLRPFHQHEFSLIIGPLLIIFLTVLVESWRTRIQITGISTGFDTVDHLLCLPVAGPERIRRKLLRIKGQSWNSSSRILFISTSWPERHQSMVRDW